MWREHWREEGGETGTKATSEHLGQTGDEGGGQSGDVLGMRKGEGWVIIYKGAGVREAVSNGPWFLIRRESSSVNLCYIVNEKVNEELA